MSERKGLRIGLDAGVFNNEHYSGIPNAVYEIVKVWMRDYPENEYFLFSGANIHLDLPLPENWHFINYSSRWFKVPRLRTILFQKSGIKKQDLDVYWGTNFVLPGKLPGVKQVVTVYDFAWYRMPYVSSRANLRKLRALAGPSYRIADRVVAISEATARDAEDFYQVPRERIRVSYCGGPQPAGELPEGAAPPQGLAEDDRFFLFLGTIEPRKNVPVIIRAFERFRDGYDAAGALQQGGEHPGSEQQIGEHQSPVKLVLAGGRGWNCEEIYAQAAESRYAADILMPGFVSKEEKAWLMANAQAFLFPSLYEGFGIPVLEAFSWGLPVITAGNSSLPEVGGDAAFYIEDCADDAALAGYMTRVIEMSAEEREELAGRGLEQLRRFSWQKNADEMMSIIREMAEEA